MKIFLYDNEWDYELNDVELNLDDTLEEFYDLSDVRGSFFGLIAPNKMIIQFTWEIDDVYLIDIPNPPTFVNFQQYANYDKCVEIIKKVFISEKIESLENMTKVDTMSENLSEVLKRSKNRQ